MYKNSLYTIFSLQTHFYVLYISLFKTILLKINFSWKFYFSFDFWPEPADRPVDRFCVRSSRSAFPVDRGSGSRCVSVCTFRGRPNPAWLTNLCSLYFSVDRAVDREPATALSFWTPVDRPVDRESRLNSNDYFLSCFIFVFFSLNCV